MYFVEQRWNFLYFVDDDPLVDTIGAHFARQKRRVARKAKREVPIEQVVESGAR